MQKQNRVILPRVAPCCGSYRWVSVLHNTKGGMAFCNECEKLFHYTELEEMPLGEYDQLKAKALLVERERKKFNKKLGFELFHKPDYFPVVLNGGERS